MKSFITARAQAMRSLGWVDLPVNYDKEEFARIKAAAEKIKKDSEILIVIGIGGSYLGARAAIEFVKSQKYNDVAADTPKIYFAGNTISSSTPLPSLSISARIRTSPSMLSPKSGTTTEPAPRVPYLQRPAHQEVRQGRRKEPHLCHYR